MEIAQTADYALAVVLELQRDDGRKVAELADSLGVSRSVMQRILETLHRRAAVIRDPDGRYWLGPLFLALAKNVPHELAVLAQPVLKRLAESSGETIVLAVPDGEESLVVASEGGHAGPLRVEYQVGFRQPLSRGATSLAILAHLDRPGRCPVPGDDGPERLARIRAEGVARTQGEIHDHMTGIAVPIVMDGCVRGALAVIAPTARAGSLDEMVPALREAAAEIAGRAVPAESLVGAS